MTTPKSPGRPPKSKSGAGVSTTVRLDRDIRAWLDSQPGTQRETVEAGLRLLMQLGGADSEMTTTAEPFRPARPLDSTD